MSLCGCVVLFYLRHELVVDGVQGIANTQHEFLTPAPSLRIDVSRDVPSKVNFSIRRAIGPGLRVVTVLL